jgi:hypothetical protein
VIALELLEIPVKMSLARLSNKSGLRVQSPVANKWDRTLSYPRQLTKQSFSRFVYTGECRSFVVVS